MTTKATISDILHNGMDDQSITDEGYTREELETILDTLAGMSRFLWSSYMTDDLKSRYQQVVALRRSVEIALNKALGEPECECFDSYERSCEMCRWDTPTDVEIRKDGRDYEATEASKWAMYNEV